MKTLENDNKNDEIDLLNLFRIIWKDRVVIIYSSIIIGVIGLFIAFYNPSEYSSNVQVFIESRNENGKSSSLLKQFGGMASLAGISINSLGGEGGFPVELIPDIVNSPIFIMDILEVKVFVPQCQDSVTIETYLKDFNRSTLMGLMSKVLLSPIKLINLLKNNEDTLVKYPFLKISKEQDELMLNLKKRIKIELNEMATTATITVEMQDPIISAIVTDKVLSKLTNYIVNYRTQKCIDNYNFINATCEESKQNYKKAQLKLAYFRDMNRNIIQLSAKSEEELLQAEYNLAFSIYSGLAQQLEQSKISIQENTPVFSIIKPIQIPIEKSKPKRIIILAISLFLGVAMGLSFIAGKRVYRSFTESFNNVNS